LVARPATGLVPDQGGLHFQVLVEPKINVIAGMAPMTGILLPEMTESGLAKLTFTP
jgi:hypothetical protein